MSKLLAPLKIKLKLLPYLLSWLQISKSPRDYFSTNEIPNWLVEQKENIHTIAFSDGVGATKVSFVKDCISKFKSLRMLDLGRSRFEELPSSIGGLKHLKYLVLTGNDKLNSLPASICELVGLESLDFRGCSNIEKLPVGFGKLIRLRELSITTNESNFPENEMRCLTSLRNLYITICPNLKFLMMGDNSDNSVAGEEGLQSLHSLDLWGLPKLEILPSWLLHGAKNLKWVRIGVCENLTNLVPEGMVESLKSLQKLDIYNCPKLVSLPEGMECLTALEEVKIVGCPELITRCERESGEDWHKISHVRDIYLDDIKI